MAVDLGSLFDITKALSVRQLQDRTLLGHGIYVIWVNSFSALPHPAQGYQRSTAALQDLVYIGIAERQTIGERLLQNDLLGVGNSTFFRSVGVCLDRWPPAKSIPLSSSNYFFVEPDLSYIRKWVEANLRANYVTEVPPDRLGCVEKHLIEQYRPFFNYNHNPMRSPNLRSLKRRALAIAHCPGKD